MSRFIRRWTSLVVFHWTLFVFAQPVVSTPLDVSAIRGAPEPPGPSSRATPLAITEIMYNPPVRTDGREVEFIEIYNSDFTDLNISGFKITGEIKYTFPTNTIVPARGFLAIAPVPADLQAVYGIANVAGGFTSRLSNGGGILRLQNKSGAVLLEIEYSNDPPWPVAADNGGHSLVLSRPSFGEADHRAWTASDVTGGTPGTAESVGINPYRTIFINEMLAHTDAPELDFIELYNYGSSPVDLAGCVLTDRADQNKFVIASGTIPARGFISFNQIQLGFALSALGETVYLKNPAGTRVLDVARFEAQANGVALGRYPDGAPGFHPLTQKTPGLPNASLVIGDVVINEIMYNPISGDDNDEFVELHNRGASPVNIGGWRFVSGIDFSFPTNTVIPANGYVVVAKNATRLLANYPGLNAGNTFGDYDGTLANGGERLALASFGQTTVTNNGVPVVESLFAIADEVTFNDGGRWSRWSDGGGSSLELVDPHGDNRLMANWADSDDSDKSQWTMIEHTGVMDHGQGAINELHLMILGRGECLVDNLEVRESSGANLVGNSTFDAGLNGWILQGNHVQSTLSAPGFGGSGNALLMRASSGGDNGANRLETDLSLTMTAGNTATIRGRARWLRGHPDVLFRVHGNHLEAAGSLPVPKNLGSPGAANTRYRPNLGPAVHDVTHSPVLPASNQAVQVRAQVNDPDGVANLVLRYRIDPLTTFTTVNMVNNGAGFYSATIPGQPSGALVAFYIESTDGFSPPATTRFPAEPALKEALIRFGEQTPAGNFGVYRLWMTQQNINTWSSREKLSNEALDGTFVYGNSRVIYNAGGRYRGSPFLRPSYNTPTGTRCAYVWTLPEDDLFLGADELNLDSMEPGDRDPTALREVTSFWMADQLGLPFSNQRYVHVVLNGVPNAARGIPVYCDTQQPDSAFMRTWFPNDDRGEIFKIDDWFEFNDSVAREFNVDARLQNYTTTGGQKKQARYRWSWEKKSNRTLNDDYTSLFSLVDALNAPDSTYVSQVENTINVDDWMTVFALRHAVGDWDGYGYSRGKNQFTYKPTGDQWKMLLWDLDFSLGCNGGHAPTQDLFTTNDPTVARLLNHPHFRRAYLNALYRIAYGPFEAGRVVPFITARYNAFLANNISPVSPFSPSGAQNIPVPDWISQRRNYIISQLASITAPFAITSNNGNSFNTNRNFITLTGTAPIEVKYIEVNGIRRPVVWTSVTTWTVTLALGAAANNLSVRGLDFDGVQVAGSQDTISITYTGVAEQPQNALVINEIMYNPVTPGAAFVEIFNRSAANAFDLSKYILNGADFAFAEGTIIPPGGYLVVANNLTGFISTYGNTIPLAGVLAGNLDNDGETLQLIAPGATPEQNAVIDEVTYDDAPPWPGLAAGFGASLQLIDPAQDNNRVANWNSLPGGGQTAPVTLIGMTDNWRYNQAGVDLGTSWVNASYSDAAWPAGPALLYVESAALPAAKNTPLTLGPRTFYFRKTFNFTGNPANTVLRINAIIDDGAVFYLNGSRVFSLGMPDTGIVYTNFANRTVDNATLEGPFVISSDKLVNGPNVLAVEVHQVNAGSTDVVFGMDLVAESNLQAPYTPGAANSTRAVLGQIPLLWLNEIQPNNVTGLQDNAGDRDPWLEIHNSSGASIDLTGYYLSDNHSNLTKWPFPAGAIAAGAFRLVWLDNEPAETSGNQLHANFRASPTNGVVILAKVSGSVTSVVDYLSYSPLNNDRSYGAFPDGSPTRRLNFYFTTPGAANDTNYPGVPVFINEWMAGNASAVTDPADGDFDDWFELFNAGPVDVDLSGFRLTDTTANQTKWTIPVGTIIPAGGHLLIWADEEVEQNGPNSLHAFFKLSLDGERILLYAPNGALVDSVTFEQQTNDISRGRWPDGNSQFHFMATFTPASANVTGSSQNLAPVLTPIGNKSGAENSPIFFTVQATDPNSGQILRFSLDEGFPSGATINESSGAFAWTPSESHGPGNHPITVRVTDNGNPVLSDFETIQITVNEVNSPPTLAPIGNRVTPPETLLTFTALGSDGDIPAQNLSFGLDEGAPAGAAIHPATGVFTWTPAQAQLPGEYPVTIIVFDNGSPIRNASETITITVRPLNRPELIAFIQANEFHATWSSEIGTRYRVLHRNSLTTGDWQELTVITATGPTSTFADTLPQIGGRFYRVEVLP